MGVKHVIVENRAGKVWGIELRVNRSKTMYLMDRLNLNIISKLMQTSVLYNFSFIHDKRRCVTRQIKDKISTKPTEGKLKSIKVFLKVGEYKFNI